MTNRDKHIEAVLGYSTRTLDNVAYYLKKVDGNEFIVEHISQSLKFIEQELKSIDELYQGGNSDRSNSSSEPEQRD